MSGDLEPLSPREAVTMYLDHRRQELSEGTLSAHYYRLKQFWEWCDREGLENLNNLSGRDLHRYRAFRLNEEDNEVTTVRGDLFTLKKYLEFCESIEAVPLGLSERVDIPTVTGDEGVSDATIEEDRLEAILAHLGRFEYASARHAMIALAWHTGCRLGAVRALDLGDLYLKPEEYELEGAEGPFLEVRHRPETETPLKNGTAGERSVNVSEEIAALLEDYIDVNRYDVEDEHGRDPLFATSQGRISTSAVRHAFYRATRPCMIGPCPHDRDPETCEAMETGRESLCPSSRAPHAIRTGAITRMRRAGIPPEVISERVNATEEVIEKHYDKTTARERMGLRRDQLDELL